MLLRPTFTFTPPAALALALALSSAAAAQPTTFHDAAGRVTGKARTNAEGTTTFYDAAGLLTKRALELNSPSAMMPRPTQRFIPSKPL